VNPLRLRSLLFAGCLAASLAARPARAQAVFPAENGQILTGVTAVDAQALVLNWLGMEGGPDALKADAQEAFQSAVEAIGVTADRNANFLFCELKVAGVGRATVVYSWSVGYYEFVVGGAHRLQWTTGGIVTVGRTNFSGATAIEECAEGFRREWTRWNRPNGR
jgi:hypothetical protein